MSRLRDTFLIKEAAARSEMAWAGERKRVERLLQAMFAQADVAVAKGDNPGAASLVRKAATEIQMTLERMAQEILQ